jgi:polyisoprenoid-binding protein YceI
VRFRDLGKGVGSAVLGLSFCLLFPSAIQSPKAAPVYKIMPVESKISFGVKASVSIEGTFERWGTKLTFRSTDVSSGILDVKIQANRVNTGSSLKDNELKSGSSKNDPYIAFPSTKFLQNGPHTFDLHGTFTLRGVSKPETLTFIAERGGHGRD